MTAEGHPHAVFRRALQRQNLLVAETLARELRRMTLTDRLELTALICLKQPERGERVAAAWVRCWIEETDEATIDEVSTLAALLNALGGSLHEVALQALIELREARAALRSTGLRRARKGELASPI